MRIQNFVFNYPQNFEYSQKLIKRLDVQIVRLVELLDEAKSRCEKALLDRRPDIDKSSLEMASSAMAYGAIKYADLKNHRSTNYK